MDSKCKHDQEYSYYSFPQVFGNACECCGIENAFSSFVVKKYLDGNYYCEPCKPENINLEIN